MTESLPTQLPSVDLVRLAQQNDPDALARLFERYYARVQRIVRLRLPAALRSRYDSVDVIQETFLIAIEAFDRFELRDEASLINWLAKIAENQIRSKRRKRSAWMEVALERSPFSGSASAFEPTGPVAAPAELAAEREEAEALELCLQQLPDKYREVVILRDFARPAASERDVPWAVVAEEVGCSSPDAARMLHNRALLELADCVQRRLGAST